MRDEDSIVITIKRLVTQYSGASARTYGSYEITVEGEPALSGFVCESRGPGDNADEDCGRRIEASLDGYGLSTHYGRYVPQGYAGGLEPPRPGLAVGNHGVVGARQGSLSIRATSLISTCPA